MSADYQMRMQGEDEQQGGKGDVCMKKRYGRIEHQRGVGGTLGKVVRVESPFVQKKTDEQKKKTKIDTKIAKVGVMKKEKSPRKVKKKRCKRRTNDNKDDREGCERIGL